MSTLRAAEEADRAAIRALHAGAFPTDAEARLVDALWSNGRNVVSLVATDAGAVVGHILFTPVTIAGVSGGPCGLGLAPLAVTAEARRRGIGAELVRAGLERCRQLAVGYVVVLGNPSYYRRFGFCRARDYALDNAYHADEEFMVIELVPGALSDVSGCVTYSTEFSAL